MKIVRNNVKGTETLNFRMIEIIQGDLKSLSVTNYEKLKRSLLRHGFISPIHVWHNPEGYRKWAALDGTQRLRTLERMELEGYKIERVPIVEVDAPDLRTAKKVLLQLSSKYGQFENQGLAEFLGDDKEFWDNLEKDYEIVNSKVAKAQFQLDHTDKKLKKCPKCDHEW